MRVSLKYFLAVFLVVAFISAGCTPSIKIARLRPAEINLSGYKKVAVGGFKGEGGEELSTQIETSLANSARFEVVDRQNLENIMREQNLSVSDSFDPKSSVKLGKMMGSSALIFGKVTRHQYYSKPTNYKTTCTSNGQTYNCTGYKVTGYWFLNSQISVVDVSTGKILVTKTYNKTSQDDVTSTEGWPEVNWDAGQVFTSMSEGITQEFMKQIAPWTEQVTVYLYKSKALPELEVGIDYAKQGNWPLAIEQFKTACATAESNPAVEPKDRARAHYDLGIALGYSGTDYNQAVAEIQKAININTESDFYNEISKINRFKADEQRLKQQGVDPGSQQSKLINIVPVG